MANIFARHRLLQRVVWICSALAAIALIIYVIAGTVGQASGGTLISADTARNGGTGAWTTLTGPTYHETVNGDLGNGTVTLNIPAGFEVNAAATVSVILLTGDNNAPKNMNNAAVGANIASTANGTLTLTSSTITFTVFSKSQGNTLNSIRWQGIQIRPINGYPLASGTITPSGTSMISVVASSQNFGTLTTVPGEMTRLLTVLPGQTFTPGSGISGTPNNQIAGGSFNLTQLVATDHFYNPITSYDGTKIISYSGPSSGCNLPPSYTTSVNFNNGYSTGTLATVLRKTETTTITASDGTVTGPASSSFAVAVGPVSRLVVTLPGETFVPCVGNTGTPANQASGVTFTIPSITATDANFNIVTGYSGTRNLSYSGPSGSPSYTTNVHFANGQSTTSLLTTLTAAETTRITVSDGPVTGPASSSFTVTSTINAFNAFESTTPAGASTGVLKTKIAGSGFSFDIVALNNTPAIASAFSGTVKVELVENSSGGSCTALPAIQALPNQTFTAADNGRRTISSVVENNAWKVVKVRISHPVSAPTIVSCSTDSFAIRPGNFLLIASDSDAQTAGTARTLNNATIPGGATHKAGQAFTLSATARNAGNQVTSNYAGTPTLIVSSCGASGSCTAAIGTLSVASWSSSAGIVSTNTARYSEVGSFALRAEDQSFAAIDAADSSTSERYITSATITVGRFVPDHFSVVPGTLTPRTDIPACSSSSFSYMDEPFSLGFRLIAENANNARTHNYAGALATLNPSTAAHLNFGAIDTAAPTPLTTRLSLISSSGTWSGGQIDISASLRLQRANTPDGPFNSVRIGIAPQDADGTQLPSGARTLDVDNDTVNDRALLASTILRFGVLRLTNAYGSELLNLRIPLQIQYWNGSFFAVNTLDNCTAFSAPNLILSNHSGGINPGNMSNPANIALQPVVIAGAGRLVLTRPLPVPTAKGSVDLRIDMAAENKTYLRGRWRSAGYSDDPTARAAFGIYRKGKVIFEKERLY